MRAFRELVERQSGCARAKGSLKGLRGEGQPLPARPVETAGDAAISAGFRMMAEAGLVPEEFQLKKQLDEAYAELAKARNGTARDAALRDVAALQMRYNIAVEARRKFMS